MNKPIYLDNNATTPLDPDVLNAMIGELATSPHNPSSVHSFGQEAKKILTDSRNTIAKLLNVKPSEIFFTSGGTEGMNFLIRGALPIPKNTHKVKLPKSQGLKLNALKATSISTGKNGVAKKTKHSSLFADHSTSQIIASPIDHPCVLNTLENLKQYGTHTSYLPIDSYGTPKAKELQQALQPNTKLIVLSAANSETGVKLDIEEIAAVAKRAKVPLILDGVALLGKEPLSIPEGVSGMAFSAHKFHGPQGIGFVFVRSGFKLTPLLTGGGQEKKLRPGTENLPGIVGMTRALTIVDEKKPFAYMKSLRKQFEAQLIANIPDLEINGEGPRLPNTSNIYFPGVDAEALLISLDMEKIAVSYASACASGALEPSRTLINMGYSKERASSSLRFSFSRMNTPEEIQKATNIIITLVDKLRIALLS